MIERLCLDFVLIMKHCILQVQKQEQGCSSLTLSGFVVAVAVAVRGHTFHGLRLVGLYLSTCWLHVMICSVIVVNLLKLGLILVACPDIVNFVVDIILIRT